MLIIEDPNRTHAAKPSYLLLHLFVADASLLILLFVSEFPVVLNVRRVLAVLESICLDGSGELSPYCWPLVLQDQVVALHRERGVWKAVAGLACYPEKPPLGTLLGTHPFHYSGPLGR